MERLTMRNSDGSYSQPTHTTFEAMFYRLAEFEDFMEEVGAESLDEIETCIVDLNKENQTLKGNWAKLKELLEEDMEHNSKEYNESFVSAFQHYSATENWVLDRMQELEGGDGRKR